MILLVGTLFISCSNQNSPYDITYFEEGDEKLEYNNVLLLWAQYEVNGEQMFPTSPDYPMAMLYDSASAEDNGDIQGVLNLLNVGDSVTFQVAATNLWEKSFRQPLPDTLAETDVVNVTLSIIDQMDQGEYQTYARELESKRNASYFEEESRILAQYIDDNNLEVQTTASGLMYQIHEEGTGPKPEVNQLVNVKYRGTTLDGNEFDAGTYEFPLGQGVVIGGWDEGIALLNKGTKATIYVPSKLGYGSRGAGRDIAPYSSLIFEVELLDIKSE